MALTVNTNPAAMRAMTQLAKSGRALSGSYARIASGLRISKAADDAAGLAVAENLKIAAKSAKVASRNTADGISMIAVAEGASSEVGNIIGRMRELAVQSASETLDDDERAYIQDEFTALSEEVDRIAAVTEFNGKVLTDATVATVAVQVGIHSTANDQIDITLGDLRTSTLGVDAVSLSSVSAAGTALGLIDTAIETVNGYRSDYGAAENRLNSALNNLEIFGENTMAAESQIRDADFGYETSELTKNQILTQAGVAILAQAKTMNQGALQLLQ
ncbi:MAG: flagellin FliC [Myxococcales bacterium]|nr:flagellin FliC [Myxococcales bacterium]